MKITEIHADLYHLPLSTPLSDATHGQIDRFELIIVRLRSDEGIEGIGYTYTPGTGGSAIHSMIVDDLAPIVVGADAGRPEELWNAMWWRVHFTGRGGVAAFAFAAIDIAAWDIQGKTLGQPLWRLLGGNDPIVEAYAGGIDLNFRLDDLLTQTSGFLDAGFKAIKMKVGRDNLREDIERVAAVREHVGKNFRIMVDANMRWSVDQAIRAARALYEYDLYWVEEPIIPEDINGHVQVIKEGRLPIATGENFHSIYEFKHIIAAGGVSFPEPDVATIGGITPWMKIAALAESYNLPITSHGVHDIHVQLLAAIPNASYLEVHGFDLNEFIKSPLEFVDGNALAPDNPGHGVEFDRKSLESYLV